MRGRKIITILIYCSLAIGAFLMLPKTADAEELPRIVISEVYYDSATANDPDEFVELYNYGTLSVDLSGYKLLSDKDSGYIIPSGTVIAPGNFLVATKNLDSFTDNFPSVIPDLIWEKISLSNSGDYIALVDGSNTDIDAVSWEGVVHGSTVFHRGVVDASLERKFDDSSPIDTDNCDDDFVTQPVPTPGKKYEKIIYSDKVIISEIVPAPADGAENEYIELYNDGDKIVDLGGWILDDDEGGSSGYIIPKGVLIPPYSYLAFRKSTTGVYLNDSGDKAQLFSLDDIKRSEVEYSGSKKGESYSKFSDGWKWSLSLTPGAENILTLEIEDIEHENFGTDETIKSARETANGEMVTVSGTVTVLPGVLSSQYFYISDDTSGIQIYCYKKDFPNFKIGDVILITGEIAEYYNEKRIKIASASDIVILSSRDPPQPITVKIDDINEGLEGRLVTVEGVVVRTSGDTFYIHGSGIIKVVIRGTTNIDKPKMRKGDKVRITGILSQYKDSYRILPLDQDDVILLSSGTLPRAGSEIVYYLLSSILISCVWMSLLLKIKKRRRSWRRVLLRNYPAAGVLY